MLYSFHSKWTLKSCIEFKSLIIFRSPFSEFEFRVAIFICVHPISCLFFSIHFLKPCKLEYKSYTSSKHVLYFLQHAAYLCSTWMMSCMHLKKIGQIALPGQVIRRSLVHVHKVKSSPLGQFLNALPQGLHDIEWLFSPPTQPNPLLKFFQ